ncbi:MAG: TonB family protein [Lewinella sp.]|nr:TonB family protein [Lewinella sp.]
MKKIRKDKDFLHKPVYPGGRKAMRQFITEQLQYPEAARAQQITGTVQLKISIDYRGQVIDSKVIVGLGFGCDEEAQRVAHLLRFEVAKNRKLRAIFHQKLNIHFQGAPTPKPVPAKPAQLAYHLTTKKEQGDTPQGQQQAYHYSIKLN